MEPQRCRARDSSLLGAYPVRVMAGLDSASDWAEIVARTNEFLGPDWPAPPYIGDQTATMALCLDLAQRGESES